MAHAKNGHLVQKMALKKFVTHWFPIKVHIRRVLKHRKFENTNKNKQIFLSFVEKLPK